jgi:predicted nucleic acid-binding protein
MPCERRNFDDVLEPLIYWDTTYAIAFFEEKALFHDECVDFERRLRNESVLSVSSDFTHNELAFHIFKTALTEEGDRTGRYWLQVKQDNPRLLLATIPTVKARRDELDYLTFQISIGEGVKQRAFALMQRYPLLPTDAYHIATALESDVTAFVTLDNDFLQVDGIIVYTCIPNPQNRQEA